jgi:Fe2+ or Zn2+ uptake regulation protein
MLKTVPPDVPVSALRDAGLRVTGPRVAILRALYGDRSHPTAERIHTRLRDDLPSLSLSTVYNTLETFIAKGLCRRVRSDGAGLRVDGITSSHDHAVCTACGRIFDVERADFRLPALPLSLPGGLEVTGVHVEYDVVCGTCRNTDTAVKGLPPEHDKHARKKEKGGKHG